MEENKISIDTLKNQLIEKEKHNDKLECEIVSLRKEIEKVKTLNLIFSKGYETLDNLDSANDLFLQESHFLLMHP